MTDLMVEAISRFIVLIEAPLVHSKMLWAALPLVIATVFITLYFGKYKKEELGWNTAFGNTMVFLFISISIVQYLYYSSGEGNWNNIFGNEFYLTLTLGLMGAALALMLITYYHLLPKKVAFFLFSSPPVNVSVYVILAMVYSQVPADEITLIAAVMLFILIFGLLKILQMLESMAGKPEGLSLQREDVEESKYKSIKNRKNKD